MNSTALLNLLILIYNKVAYLLLELILMQVEQLVQHQLFLFLNQYH